MDVNFATSQWFDPYGEGPYMAPPIRYYIESTVARNPVKKLSEKTRQEETKIKKGQGRSLRK